MQHLKEILSSLPESPGVYQFYDKSGQIIYIGKAKSLRKRVSNYFQKQHDSGKTIVMVRNIADIKTINVETEMDALLLENNLIKKHQPKYNVNLRDDKTYPWICIKNERFPRIFFTRKFIRDGSEYYGPYTSVRMVDVLLELFTKLFKRRNCYYNLSEENIAKKKFRVCLEYHLGNCKGPCENLQSQADYDEGTEQIRQILKGNISVVLNHLKEQMNQYSDKMEYEKAHQLKEKIDHLDHFQKKSTVVNPSIHNVDVFSIRTEDDLSVVNFLKVMNGSIVQAHTVEIKKKLDETKEDLLELAIAELRERFQSDSKEIIIPFPLNVEMPGIETTIPQRGDKRHLLLLSEKNVIYYLREKKLQLEKINPENRVLKLLELMKKELRLKELPRHIECFDNSNIQGDYPVAALTVFRNTKPSKKDYRHFNIKTVEGPDDFASMEEIIFRRYKRMLDEAHDLPQLIVIDGGKGQLSAAMKSLKKLGLKGKIAVIGIAKRLEEIYYPGDSVPLYLDKKSETLRVIQQIRDEAHRFGITHHRKKRSKGVVKTELNEIKGIGEKIAGELLKHFRSVKKIKEASKEELTEVIGKAKAKIVFDHFNS